ncbi:PspA-associated protein PspAB [Streptomyces sp. NRRL S-1868]|uniref:PspA-associated protein PspAB n=1 Tax=Streptomyces sp. NRRL S-1868 TaxID=1463892 RepID=UPI0004C91574
MGFLDTLLGRSKPKRPDLDQLFALPSAAVTLEAGAAFVPTGVGAVCFASVEGGAFERLRQEVRALLDADTERGGIPVEFGRDDYGYTWLTARHGPHEVAELVSDLHAVNTLLVEGGFGPQLLCSLVDFAQRDTSGPGGRPGDAGGSDASGGSGEAGASGGSGGSGGSGSSGGSGRSWGSGEDGRARSLALIYLYKRGTFYPFAPLPGGGEKRDNGLELQVRALLADDLPIEQDLSRWFPVWGAPGL